MTELRKAIEDYINIRQGLGFEFQSPARCLRKFGTFMECEGASHITTELALRWAKQPAAVQPATWAWRLAMVRRFALWYKASDPCTEVPPEGLLPHKYCRKPPYIYNDEEIEKIVRAAKDLPSAKGLRGLTYSTLFGLLAVTGMRGSEALALDREDVNLKEGILTIRRTKFGKTRIVPIHSSTCDALKCYADKRNQGFPRPATRGFFISERGVRITGCLARYTFAKISRQIGLRVPSPNNRHGHGPRLHDMRHRFAVKILVNWYRAGIDVEREISKLSTYLGHVHVNDTYWYLEAVPELLNLATERLMTNGKEVEL